MIEGCFYFKIRPKKFSTYYRSQHYLFHKPYRNLRGEGILVKMWGGEGILVDFPKNKTEKQKTGKVNHDRSAK